MLTLGLTWSLWSWVRAVVATVWLVPDSSNIIIRAYCISLSDITESFVTAKWGISPLWHHQTRSGGFTLAGYLTSTSTYTCHIGSIQNFIKIGCHGVLFMITYFTHRGLSWTLYTVAEYELRAHNNALEADIIMAVWTVDMLVWNRMWCSYN